MVSINKVGLGGSNIFRMAGKADQSDPSDIYRTLIDFIPLIGKYREKAGKLYTLVNKTERI